MNDGRGGLATGGVSTSGARGLGCRATLGAGRTSIGGGSGATCWLTTGGLGVEVTRRRTRRGLPWVSTAAGAGRGPD